MQRQIKLPLFLVLSLFLGSKIQAQNCIENLYGAGKLLDAGNYNGCLTLVRACSSVDKQESVRWQAYRLMSIAFILQGNPDSAKLAGENMLNLNPTYTVNPLKDPKEFINLLNKIVVIPRYTLGLAVSAGTNVTIPNITQGYVVSDYQKNYLGVNSTQFGTNLGFYLNPKWKIDVGLYATTKSYKIDYSFSDWKINYAEKLTYIELPITAKYIFLPYKRFRMFANAGVFGGGLIYAQNNLKASNTPSGESYSLNKLNSMDRRNKVNFGLCGGLGVFYKLKTGQLNFETNYFHSLKGITKAETRYNYIDLIYNYYYVDDDIKLNNFTFNIGYSFYLNYKVYHKK